VEIRYVFVTASARDGILGGLSGADSKCQTEATNAGLTGTYKAWLSDATTSAANRLEHFTGQYKLVDGSVVATSWNQFTDGILDHAINKTAANGSISSGNVWTGSNANGTTATMRNNCDNWTDNSGGPEGTTTAIGTTMTVNDFTECYTS
jgi:hypothetical protein